MGKLRPLWIRVLSARFLPFAIGMVFLAAACDIPLLTQPTATPTATDTPTPTNTPTNTLTPTITPSPTVDKTATKRAKEEATIAAKTAIAEAVMDDIDTALEAAGEEKGSGSVLYANPGPVVVESSGSNGYDEKSLDEDVDAADFAFHSTVKWEVKQRVGLVDCLLYFRVPDNPSVDPFYVMIMGRVSGAGHLWFSVFDKGSLITSSPLYVNNSIDTENAAENDVLLVARGPKLSVYVNGTSVAKWSNAKAEHGTFLVAEMQDVGDASCTWSNTWVWGFE